MRSFAEQWKERCKKFMIDEESPKVVDVGQDPIPCDKRYYIVKRSTDGSINKVVAIGFTKEEAGKWIERKVNKAKEVNDVIIFYDIVDQDNKEELNPLWNPRPCFLGDII